MKVELDSKEIKFLEISDNDGRILKSGEREGFNDTFEDSFVDLKTVEVGKKPMISFNKGVYERRKHKIEPVWTELAYKVLKIC